MREVAAILTGCIAMILATFVMWFWTSMDVFEIVFIAVIVYISTPVLFMIATDKN